MTEGLMAIVDGEAIEEEPNWQERALCAQTDPEAFFPEKGGSTREASSPCRRNRPEPGPRRREPRPPSAPQRRSRDR